MIDPLIMARGVIQVQWMVVFSLPMVVEQDFSIELPRHLGAKLFNCCGDHLVFRVLEKLPQGQRPVQPYGVDLNFVAVIGHDDMIHGPDVVAGIDLDCFA
jgi:hypothetical protein